MSLTININGLTLCHRGSSGISHNTLPDICMTPEEGVPVPFDNEAYSKDLADGTTTVFADGGNMIANLGSIFATSILDEGGSYGGIISGTNLAEADFITHSFDVFFEGKAACRLTDKMWMNHRNTVNMAGEKQGALTPRDRKIQDKLCPAICVCSNTVAAAVASGSATLDPAFWLDAIEKQGGIPTPAAMKSRTQQECVASQFSSGWPVYTPKPGYTPGGLTPPPDLLAETTFKIPSSPANDFELVKSQTIPPRTTYPDGPTAPASPPSAMGQVGPGKIFAKGETVRWDFTQVINPSKSADAANVERYVEIKFDGDELTKNQKRAQAMLKRRGEQDKLLVINEADCKCDGEPTKQAKPHENMQWDPRDETWKGMGDKPNPWGPPPWWELLPGLL